MGCGVGKPAIRLPTPCDCPSLPLLTGSYGRSFANRLFITRANRRELTPTPVSRLPSPSLLLAGISPSGCVTKPPADTRAKRLHRVFRPGTNLRSRSVVRPPQASPKACQCITLGRNAHQACDYGISPSGCVTKPPASPG